MISNPLIAHSGNDWPKTRKLSFLICLIGFMFQLYRITAHYYRYETEFQTKLFNGNKDVLDLPAITLCVEYDVIYLKSSLRKQFPTINEQLRRIDNDSESDKYFRKYMVYRERLKSLNLKSIFEHSIKDTDFVDCILWRQTKWMDERKMARLSPDCSALSPVLESKVYSLENSGPLKCFTFFSRQQSQINERNDLQIDMKQFEYSTDLLEIVISTDQFKESLMNTGHRSVFMFIHDSYRMPSFETKFDAIELKPGKTYDIRFWSTTKSLLKPPFPSNCFDYHKNLKSKEPKSEDQCETDCYVEKSVQAFNCYLPRDLIVNDDKLKAYNPNYCTKLEHLDYLKGLITHCRQICHQDCQRTDYKFDVKESSHNKFAIPTGDQFQKFGIVHLKYQKEKEAEYVERPVQSMCATIQMMFYAVLIWFGLSIFSFSSIFEMAVNKAKPHMYYIQAFDDKVSPSVISVVTSNKSSMGCIEKGEQGVHTEQPMIKPRFAPTRIGSNVKLEHYNDFISKVVDGYPTAQTVELPQKSVTQY